MRKVSVPKIIDCTFRDGGYYTDWVFDKAYVEKTLAVLANLPIEYVEIGFRKFESESKSGALAHTTDEYIENLAIPSNINLTVMVMLKDFDHLDLSCFHKLFPNADKSRVQLIRIASSAKDIDKILYVTDVFKDLGYKVANNITHISTFSDQDITTYFKRLNNARSDMVLIADTFGDLVPDRLKTILKLLADNFSKDYGFHAHDNCGLAFANALAAIEAGATYIDATILGMGRGAGNLRLESLLLYLYKNNKDIDLHPLMHLLETYFSGLKKQYGWGYSHLYHYGMNAGVHPTLMQKLLEDSTTNFETFVKAIEIGKK